LSFPCFKRVRSGKWTGIPVSVGIGPTKVLAKVASTIAKRRPEYGGVVDLSGPDADPHHADFDVGEVWGIGPRYAQLLKSEGEENLEQPNLWEASGLPPVLRKQKIETAAGAEALPRRVGAEAPDG
jgi:hypothetical protein